MKVKDLVGKRRVVDVLLRVAFFDCHVRTVFSKSRRTTMTQRGETGIVHDVSRKQNADTSAMMQDEHVA